MFGVLRTLLAMMVLVGHLGGHVRLGTYAVFAFYIISGYLMTLVMHESYGYARGGRVRFAANRFLRLYPLYWFCLAFSAAVIFAVGERFAVLYEKHLVLPSSPAEFASVLSMMFVHPFPNRVVPNLLPASWALTVELFFYVLIALGISKTRRRVVVWLVASVAYVIYCHYTALPWEYKYYPVAAASLPFSLGAFIYFLKSDGYPSISEGWVTSPVFLSVLLLANSAVFIFKPGYFQTGFYLSLFIAIFLVFELATGRQWRLFGVSLSANRDKSIGDYSYPIYLLHWPVGLLVAALVWGHPTQSMQGDGLTVLLLSVAAVLVISRILLAVVASPLEKLRVKIKSAGG